GEEREEVDVLMAEEPRRTGSVVRVRDRGVIVETEAEVRAREFRVEEMRVAAEVGEKALHHRQDQLFVSVDDSAEELGLLRHRPERWRVLKGPAAEHPPLDQVGVHVARLLDREVALI